MLRRQTQATKGTLGSRLDILPIDRCGLLRWYAFGALHAGTRTLICRADLGLATGVESTFSFSCSLVLEALEAASRCDTRVLFLSDSSDDEGRRWVFTIGVSDDERARFDATREGVADLIEVGDVRILTADGGPMLASDRREEFTADPFGRTLLASDRRGAVDKESPGLRSFVVLLTSDRAEGGRATLGVPKIELSRREDGFGAGVAPTAILAPVESLLIWSSRSANEQLYYRDTYLLKFLLLCDDGHVHLVLILLELDDVFVGLHQLQVLVGACLLELVYLPAEAFKLLGQSANTFFERVDLHVRLCALFHELLHVGPSLHFASDNFGYPPTLFVHNATVIAFLP